MNYTFTRAVCACVTHVYMKVAGGKGGEGAPRFRFRWGKEKVWYHAVGLDEQKVVLLWIWRIKGEQAKHLGESGSKWSLETAENLSKNFAGHGPLGDLTHCVQITT